MIFVVATIEVAPGQRDAFLAEFHKLVPQVQDEDGCIEYGPAVDFPTNIDAQGEPRPNVVTVMEKWEDIEALEAHLVAPHMVDYRGRVKDLVRSVQLQVLQPV